MVDFTKSDNDEIDSSKYSFEEIILNTELDLLSFDDRIKIADSWLKDLEYRNLSLKRKVLETGSKEIIKIYDHKSNKTKEYINLASNDYLNLTHHPEIIEEVKKAAVIYGCGAGAASHALGTTRLHDTLEKKIAQFKGCESAIIFSCGFSANTGTISSLLKKNDIAIIDQFAHRSLVEGANRRGINAVHFRHNDLYSLEYILKKARKEYLNRLVIVDGIYSMEGDIAPLDKIYELTQKYDAWLLVDDAHGTGTIGEKGKGSINFFGLEGKVDIVTGTFSKALGSVGGFVAGKKKFIDYLELVNSSFIFSTSAFLPSVAASLKAIELIENEPELLNRLNWNSKLIRDGLKNLGYNISESVSPIIPVIIGNEKKAYTFGEKLKEHGIISLVSIYPAVPKGLERLRISVSAGLSDSQLNYILETFKKLRNIIE